MTVAELRWVDSPLWHLPYLVVSTSAGAVRVDSEAARRAAMEAAGDDADTEPGWDVLKNQVRKKLSRGGQIFENDESKRPSYIKGKIFETVPVTIRE